MTAKIESVENGYIITYDDYDADSRDVKRKVIIEEDDDTPEQTKQHRAYARLCWELMGIMGVFNSKHLPERVVVEMEKQDGSKE